MRIYVAFLLLFVLLTPGPGYTTEERVEIFVTAGCPYCGMLEQYLQKLQVDYDRYDIERSAKAAKIHEELGGGGVPLIRIGDTILRGFEPLTLTSVLKRYGLYPSRNREERSPYT